MTKKFIISISTIIFICACANKTVQAKTIKGSGLEYQREVLNALTVEFDYTQTFRINDRINIKYYVINSSGFNYLAPQKPISSTLHTIQYLDNDGVIDALPQGAKYTGIPGGFGYNIPTKYISPKVFYHRGVIKKGQKFPFKFSLSTRGFNPGSYRLYVDLRLFDKSKKRVERKRFHIDFDLE